MNYNIIEQEGNNLLDFKNKIIIFNFINYFNFLLKGYNNDKEIENQFIIDSLRNLIKYNNYKINNIEQLNIFLKKKYKYSILKKIYIFSSQTMFSYIYKLFVDILPDNYYFAELDEKCKNIKKIKIFYKNEKNLKITIYKCMRIFQFDNNDNVKDLIYLILIYNIDLENDNMIYCNIKYFNNIDNLIFFYKNI